MNFTLDESKAILKDPIMDGAMRAQIKTRGASLPVLPAWPYAGKQIPISPFRLLRTCVESAVLDSVACATGLVRQRLLLLLHMVEGDDAAPVAAAVAETVESYAVEMQHGTEGLRNYRAFVAGHVPQ